ncbi:MAG TPA: polysaccharide deacetylase family protein [Candidatus Acidoferrum sp.]|nr:polysaccharide deacetylase family protein [Candidatus Acidoferrum sp.]
MAHPVPILMYHSVDWARDPRSRRWAVSPTLFAEHMRWLADHGYRPVTISTLRSACAAGSPLPPRTLAITFDDGLRDFLTEAVPVLERCGFPATLYVVTGYVGKTNLWSQRLGEQGRPMLNWTELRALPGFGVECGAHTHSHPQLDLLPPAEAFAEVRRSKHCLEDHLGRAVHAFAYPHGYASPTTRDLVRQAGFTSACRVRHALSSTDEDAFALSRIIMTNDIRVGDLGALLTGKNLPIAPSPDRLASIGWRLARKVCHSLRRWSERPIVTADCDRIIAKDRPETGGRS